MDIFIRKVPTQATTDQLSEFLRDCLLSHGISTYEIKKPKKKNIAFLTIPDPHNALWFLKTHGVPPGALVPVQPLKFFGNVLDCRQSKNAPSALLVEALKLSEKKKMEKQAKGISRRNHSRTEFRFRSLSCGVWQSQAATLTFEEQFRDRRQGAVLFGKSSLCLLLHRGAGISWSCRIDIPYYSIEHVICSGTYSLSEVTLTLNMPPRIYSLEKGWKPADAADQVAVRAVFDIAPFDQSDLAALMSSLSMTQPTQPEKRARLCSIDESQARIVGICMVYRISLADTRDMNPLWDLLKEYSTVLLSYGLLTQLRKDPPSMLLSINRLNGDLGNLLLHENVPFKVRFQLHRLASNGFLQPLDVRMLFNQLASSELICDPTSAAVSIRRLGSQIPVPGPDTVVPSLPEIMDMLKENVTTYLECEEESAEDLARRHQHLVMVYKVVVTPTGMLLDGPDPEVSNRVLRRYSTHSAYFLRVTFSDENGMPVQFDQRATQEAVFRGRFKGILRSGISIAGRQYKFLGFSHSSLRSQTCWFMAPFVYENRLIWSADVIEQIGDFTHLRSPAKCAARIGQAFSDTMASVSISSNKAMDLPDIERNGRTFSDGCGTISRRLLANVWAGYSLGKTLRPTILQIRYAGAKGVVSLDPTLKGEVIGIRRSMEKFKTSSSVNDIEICGAAYKPLPMYLNRQFIKILEDLGVNTQYILDLQSTMVENLKRITLNPVNAAIFLEWAHVGGSTRTAILLRLMHDIGLNFQQDRFLTDIIEVVSIAQLRDIKHRARILVDKGYTLYGIMDEWNILKEGEIYVPILKQDHDGRWNRTVLVQNQVVITRAPALHPGDIQVVKAVNVQADSPLKHLYNCVVFSQRGERDLPSQLSGGDLDGDLYNVIFDRGLIPEVMCTPADYPRQDPVDIGRTVTTEDMTDFFLTFMETDQLGRISNLHQIVADRQSSGTFDSMCIKLAELASTAVDFSKSGIPVDLKEIPRVEPSNVRPDFMAPGPRVFVEKGISIEEMDEDDEKDPVEALDPDTRRYRYYESPKVLGRLYRAIDEKEFFDNMRKDSESSRDAAESQTPLMRKLWKYVQRETPHIQWKHYTDLAKNLRETYEWNLTDIMETYSPHPKSPLTELEVFAGTILGKNAGVVNKRVRETAKEMVERFNRDVDFVVSQITEGEDGDRSEALPRALACFANAMQEDKPQKKKKLQSWTYLTAAVCLDELQKFQRFLRSL